uniref:hypothetical protein n=1 Tax=Ndongobacter massiliensis TaxID=1871025 RepID=UPI00092FFFAC|nr:hypothetical protein [Ndongobacter massiliensis]
MITDAQRMEGMRRLGDIYAYLGIMSGHPILGLLHDYRFITIGNAGTTAANEELWESIETLFYSKKTDLERNCAVEKCNRYQYLIDVFERATGCYVYYAVETKSVYGLMLALLYVSPESENEDDEEEEEDNWEYERPEPYLHDGQMMVSAFVYNLGDSKIVAEREIWKLPEKPEDYKGLLYEDGEFGDIFLARSRDDESVLTRVG